MQYIRTQPRTQYFLPICTHARALQIPVPCPGARRLTGLKSPVLGLFRDVSIVAAVLFLGACAVLGASELRCVVVVLQAERRGARGAGGLRLAP